jgi:hypothetical protein
MADLIATVIDLTDRVHVAIDEGNWLRAQEIEAERRRLLEQLACSARAEELAGAFTEIEARNQRLIGLVQHHKRRVLREAAVARTANAGALAYARQESDAAPRAK